jgi:thiamine transport system ATP-binding protein
MRRLEPATVELVGVTFRYEDMRMRFDLAVAAGEFLALIGPSGAGKTTLLSLIAGFERPDEGRILIAGADVTALAPADRPVTTLFQENNLFAHLDVAANVGLGIDPGLRLGPGDHARVGAALARVGLAGLERRLPGQLSGGERQRAALARSLVRDRPVLLLDEPFAALGPALRREMLDLVQDIRRERGLTVLLVSHQPEDARHAADRTAFVHDGRILKIAPTAALFDAGDVPELRDYLGRS